MAAVRAKAPELDRRLENLRSGLPLDQALPQLRGETLDILQAVLHGAKNFLAVEGFFHDRINA